LFSDIDYHSKYVLYCQHFFTQFFYYFSQTLKPFISLGFWRFLTLSHRTLFLKIRAKRMKYPNCLHSSNISIL